MKLNVKEKVMFILTIIAVLVFLILISYLFIYSKYDTFKQWENIYYDQIDSIKKTKLQIENDYQKIFIISNNHKIEKEIKNLSIYKNAIIKELDLILNKLESNKPNFFNKKWMLLSVQLDRRADDIRWEWSNKIDNLLK